MDSVHSSLLKVDSVGSDVSLSIPGVTRAGTGLGNVAGTVSTTPSATTLVETRPLLLLSTTAGTTSELGEFAVPGLGSTTLVVYQGPCHVKIEIEI